jgi:hypothetical protein
MALGDVIARLAVSLSLETAALEKGATLAEKRMEQSRKSFEKFGKKVSGIGKSMSLALTAPIVAFGYSAVKAAQESAEAMGQVEAALKSMGKGAGRTADQLQALASKQMRKSLYDDDEILRKVTANLLTFGNVAGEQFDRAQQAALDLSARMDTDLQSSALMLGKALNDPIKGLASLRRVGIQFTEQQQAQIKAMVEVGDTAGAQTVMLGELERQFGGAAQAMRDANPTAAMKQAWDEFQETVGEKLLPILPRIAEALTKIIDAFGKLSPEMQTALIIGAGLAAALGPVLVVIGGLVTFTAPLFAFVKSLWALAGAQATLAGSAGVVAAGLGSIVTSLLPIAGLALGAYLVWKNWDDIAPRLQPLIEQLTAIGEGLGLVETKAGATAEELEKAKGFRTFGQELSKLNRGIAEFVDTLDSSSIKFGQWWSSSYEAWAQSQAARSRAFWMGLKNDAINAMRDMVNGIGTWLSTRLNAVWKSVTDKIATVKAAFFGLYDAVVGNSYIPDMVDGIAAHMARLEAVMVDPAKRAAKKTAEAMRDAAKEIHELLDGLFPEIGRADAFIGEAATLKASGLTGAALDEAMRRSSSRFFTGSPYGRSAAGPDLGDTETDHMAAAQKGIDAFIDRMERMRKQAEDTRVRIAKSFKDMADDTLSALSRMTNAIKGGGFLDILEAVIGFGLQLGSIGAFGKKIQGNINRSVPAYAGGTNFHPGGMALVGERGPELVSMPRGSRVTPNNKLGGGVLDIRPSPLFEVFLDGKLIQAMPIAAQAGAQGGVAMMQHKASRRWR